MYKALISIPNTTVRVKVNFMLKKIGHKLENFTTENPMIYFLKDKFYNRKIVIIKINISVKCLPKSLAKE
jgi:hypothetical protein